jgi:hypothetical protein
MIIVPLSPVPSQIVKAVLGGQRCDIAVYQKTTGLFFDLKAGRKSIVNAVICRDGVNLVTQSHLGFLGTLVFGDMQGSDDPIYTGIGTRFFLFYKEHCE